MSLSSSNLNPDGDIQFMKGTFDYSWQFADEGEQSVLHFKINKPELGKFFEEAEAESKHWNWKNQNGGHTTVLYTQRDENPPFFPHCSRKTHDKTSHALKHASDFGENMRIFRLHKEAIEEVKNYINSNVKDQNVELYKQKCGEGSCDRSRCTDIYKFRQPFEKLVQEKYLQKVTDETLTEKQIIHTLDRINDTKPHTVFEEELLNMYNPVVDEYFKMAKDVISAPEYNHVRRISNDPRGEGKIIIYIPSLKQKVILGTASKDLKGSNNTAYQIVSFYKEKDEDAPTPQSTLKFSEGDLDNEKNFPSKTGGSLFGPPQRGSRKSSILLLVKDFLGLY